MFRGATVISHPEGYPVFVFVLSHVPGDLALIPESFSLLMASIGATQVPPD